MKIKTINDYIKRLVSCGYSDCNALGICNDFLKNYNEKELNSFISSLEKDKFNYVDRI